MQELLWLLLPVAAASGWWAAMRTAQRRSSTTPGEHNPVYFRGLNHLLNEEPDKAIDLFVEMLEVDSDTVETHLALGNLFRRRGEVERAIRIHQNLIARPALTTEQRGQALLELGQDYLRAGLYDRAENLFNELRQNKLHLAHALRHLLTIYQQEKDWEACLRTAEELERHAGEDRSVEKSHYYCELAEQALQKGHRKEARERLRKALSVSPRCVRATHLLARVERDGGRVAEALRLLTSIVEQDSDYLPEVLEEVAQAYRALGQRDRLRRFLLAMADRYPNRGAELFLVDLIHELEGEQAAIDYLSDYIARTPSLLGLMRLLELRCNRADGHNDGLLNQVRTQLNRLMQERGAYQCGKCGFEAKSLHWQCPSCHAWASIRRRPLRDSDL
ncbi:MAG: lipopolysaccharide assembly protein LapB [Gammaproteobacteria bacterium]|nr:MAG: lipopolysaccharide assembly protein LapB [Gammaproteobacteria bacterium]